MNATPVAESILRDLEEMKKDAGILAFKTQAHAGNSRITKETREQFHQAYLKFDEGSEILRNLVIQFETPPKTYLGVKVGDTLYIPSSYYIEHGEDDICGGKATVIRIETSDHLPEDHYNYYMVNFAVLPRGHTYNLRYLLEEQEKLKGEYGDKLAHPCPDR